jgi:hypothetical protein
MRRPADAADALESRRGCRVRRTCGCMARRAPRMPRRAGARMPGRPAGADDPPGGRAGAGPASRASGAAPAPHPGGADARAPQAGVRGRPLTPADGCRRGGGRMPAGCGWMPAADAASEAQADAVFPGRGCSRGEIGCREGPGRQIEPIPRDSVNFPGGGGGSGDASASAHPNGLGLPAFTHPGAGRMRFSPGPGNFRKFPKSVFSPGIRLFLALGTIDRKPPGPPGRPQIAHFSLTLTPPASIIIQISTTSTDVNHI